MTNLETPTPVLTPEEWAEGEFESHYGVAVTSLQVDHKGRLFATSSMPDSEDFVVVILNEYTNPSALHKTAALCLYQQPFGFTQEDVTYLRGIASDPFLPHDGVADSLAQRIKNLLPPK